MTFTPTLSQYLLRHLADHPDQRDLVMMMSDLATIAKYISRETNHAGLVNILGSAEKTNIQGEEVQKLDELANTICKTYLRETGRFAAMASEEEDVVVDMGTHGMDARYVIAFDPLDGSSNIDANVSIGTIFSVHKRLDTYERTDERQFLQPGRDQVLAGYVIYGSSTVLVFSFGDGVHEFTLEQSLGEFLLSRERVMIPDTCAIYSVNEGNTSYFDARTTAYISYLKSAHHCGTRYIGSLVADIHRNLLKGGIFLYPAIDKEGNGIFKGKLRTNFELKPMALLIEQAGGVAIDGAQNMLDIPPTSLHERRAFIAGNKDMVEKFLEGEINGKP